VLRKACGVVISVAERIWKTDCVKTLNGYWSALEQKCSLSLVISESRDSMTQIIDELKSNDIDGANCLECKRVEQVSLRYFSIFDFLALCCGFGGSGGAGWSNCHVWCSDCVGDSEVPSGAASFTPRDWCQSIGSLNPVWPSQPLWFLDKWNPSPG